MEFLNDFDPLLRTFWYVALPTSLIFAVQTLMTFVGADASDGVDADFDSNLSGTAAPFQLFSLRNLINFLLGFSWTGISLYSSIPNQTILIIIAILVGVAFVYVFFSVIKQVRKLAEDNSFQFSETLNKTAKVYLTIPANKSGTGKVTLSIRGSHHELDAITEHDKIETGSVVKIVRVEDNLLIVENL